jgi:hypothetical protein
LTLTVKTFMVEGQRPPPKSDCINLLDRADKITISPQTV